MDKKKIYTTKSTQYRCNATQKNGQPCNCFVPTDGARCRHHKTSEKHPDSGKQKQLQELIKPPQNVSELVVLLATTAALVSTGQLDHLTGQSVAAIGRVALQAFKQLKQEQPEGELENMTVEELQQLLGDK